MRKTIGALAITLLLGGCQAHTLGGAALGGLGGAYGGSKIGQGQGNLAATAAGALLGAGAGGYLGSFFDQSNQNAASIQQVQQQNIQQMQQQNNVGQQPTYYCVAPGTHPAPMPYRHNGQSIPMNCSVQHNYVVCNSN